MNLHTLFFLRILALLLLSLFVEGTRANGLSIEQVQRDYQARYHLITGEYLEWPQCKAGSSPAPNFPKDGFYGDLNEDPDEGVRLVQDLVQKFYVDRTLFTHFVKALNGYDSIEGAGTVEIYAATDFMQYGQNDVTSETYSAVLSTVGSAMAKLVLVKVQAEQLVTEVDDFRMTSLNDVPSFMTWNDVESCVAAKHAQTSWGYWWHYWSDQLSMEACPIYGTGQVDGYGYPGRIARISELFRDNSSTFGVKRNIRGKIIADLSDYRDGIAKVFLKLRDPDCEWTHHVDECTPIFGQSAPVGVDKGEYGEWIEAAVDLGQMYESDYVTYSEDVPEPVGVLPNLGESLVYGWEVEDAIVVVQPDFTATPDDQDCCSCDCEAGSMTASVNSVHVNIPLGPELFGASAGTLTLDSETPSSKLYTPEALRYSVHPGVEVIKNTSVTHLQFKSSQTLADVFVNTAYKFTVNVHLSTDAGTKDGDGFYQPSNPFTTITFENPDAATATNRLRIARTSDSATEITDYVYNEATGAWEMATGGGLRKEGKESTWNAENTLRTETVTVKDSENTVVFEEVNVYALYTWGQERVTNILDPDGLALTSTWAYYTNAATDGGNYRQLKEEVSSSGHWVRYQYDSLGRETNRVTQFMNSPLGSAESLNRVTTTAYSTTAPQITIIEKLLNTEIGRQYTVTSSGEVQDIRTTTPGALWSATGNLVTITKKYTTGDFAGETKRINNPDGTAQIYLYSTNTTEKRTVVLSGYPDSGNETNLIEGTISVTATALNGKIQWRTVHQRIPGFPDFLTDQDNYTYLDTLNRSYRVVHLDGTTNQYNYACCGLESEIDRDGVATTYIYDGLKRQVGTMRNGIITTNWLDPNGGVLSRIRVGTNGSAMTLSTAGYDLAGRMTNSTDALQETTTYDEIKDGNGQTVRMTIYPDLSTQIETFAMDGTLLKVTGTAVRPVRYTNSVETSGPDTGKAYRQEIKLDSSGNDTLEWAKQYFDVAGRVYKVLFSDGSYSQSFYNTKGQLWKEVDPDSVTTLYVYNNLGQVRYTVLDMDRDGIVDYTGTDRISETLNDVLSGHGTTIKRVRNYVWATNNVNSSTLVSTRETSVDGLKTWSHAFGQTNRTVTAYPGSGVRYATNFFATGPYTVSRFERGLLISTVQYSSSGTQIGSTTYGYDPHGRQFTMTDARNGTTTFTFNTADQVASVTTPVSGIGQTAQVTVNQFDNMGRVWKAVLPDTTSITNEYHPTGDIKKTYGSRTYPVEYAYDSQGRMTNMTTWQNYPASGSASTKWYYDERGFLTNKVYTDGLGTVYGYTAAGRTDLRKWARGVDTVYAYNNAGEVQSITYTDGTVGMTNTYDRVGRLTSVNQGGNIMSMAFGSSGQFLAETSNGFTVTNTYDSFLRRSGVSVNGHSGTVTSYGYDTASRLGSVTNGSSVATYAYHPNSRLVSSIGFTQSGAARLSTVKNYDNLNRLTQISSLPSSGAAISFNYGYNSANQRTVVTNAESRWSFQYDDLGQVVSGRKYWLSDGAPVAGQQFEYGYDDIGNRQFAGGGGDEWGQNLAYQTYTANSLNQYTQREVPNSVQVLGTAASTSLVTVNNQPTERQDSYYRAEIGVDNIAGSVYQGLTNIAVLNQGTNSDIVTNITGNIFVPQTPEVFLYDADGNLTNDGRWTYVWDAENRLANMTAHATVPTSARLKLDFTYDPRSRRTSKKVSAWNGASYTAQSTNKFVYDGWNLLAEFNPGNALIRNYVWGIDLSGDMEGAGGVGGLLAMNLQTEGIQFVAYDGNGNVSGLVSASTGTKTATYEYSPFGEVLRKESTSSNVNPFGFSTKYQDSESDRLYYGYRYYNADNGQWLSKDPAGRLGGNNLYGFVGNSPFTHIDILGLFELQFDWFDGFTDAEKGIVRDVVKRVGERAGALIPEVETEIKRLKEISCGPKCLDQIVKELEKVIVVLGRIQSGAASDSENLEVEKSDLGSRYGALEDIFFVPSPGYDAILQLNTNKKNDWLTGHKRGELAETFMHEISHKYGTEDHDGAGPLMHAEELDDLMNEPVVNWSGYRRLLFNCGKSLLPQKRR